MKKQFTQTVPAFSSADPVRARQVLGEHHGVEAVARVVRQGEDLLLGLEPVATTTGPKVSSRTTRAVAGASATIVGRTPHPSPTRP